MVALSDACRCYVVVQSSKERGKIPDITPHASLERKSSLQSTYNNMTNSKSLKMQCCSSSPICGTAAPLAASYNSFIRTPAKFWLTPFGTLCGTIIVSTWLPNSALWMHYTKDTSRAKPKPFEFHPVLLIGYCLKPFLSTWKSDMFRLKQESALF